MIKYTELNNHTYLIKRLNQVLHWDGNSSVYGQISFKHSCTWNWHSY